MPPKKKEEIDISQLPPFTFSLLTLHSLLHPTRLTKFLDQLQSSAVNFLRFYTREDIIQTCKDKQLYVDPNNLTDKQKKDQKGLSELPTELTPMIMAKGMVELLNEVVLNERKMKKEKIDAENAPVVESKQKDGKKKDEKKQGKKEQQQKEKEQQEKKEEEEEKKEEVKPVVQKEYPRTVDALIILTDYPSTIDEYKAISDENQILLNSIELLQEKIIEQQQQQDILLEAANINAEQKQQLEDEIFDENEQNLEGQENEEEEQIPKADTELTPDEQHAHLLKQQLITEFQVYRGQQPQKSPLRNLTIVEHTLELDVYQEQESLNQFLEQFYENICAFTLDEQSYNQWLRTKKEHPLQQKGQQQEEKISSKVIKQELDKLNQELEERKQLALQAKSAKKGGKKQQQGMEEEGMPTEQELEQIKKLEQQLFEREKEEQLIRKKIGGKLDYYNKMLDRLYTQIIKPNTLLEALVEQLEFEKERLANLYQEENDQLLDELTQMINSYEEQSLADLITQAEIESFEIKRDQQFIVKNVLPEKDYYQQNQEYINQQGLQLPNQEKEIMEMINYPGIYRNQMPEIPEKSSQIQLLERCQCYPFINNEVPQFEYHQHLYRFSNLLNINLPYLANRIYMERYNQWTLEQNLFNCMLQPFTSVQSYYNDKNDNLYQSYSCPLTAGRFTKQKFIPDWRVLPNLENWLAFFKNSESNLRNEIFYKLDYEDFGNINQILISLFPADGNIFTVYKNILSLSSQPISHAFLTSFQTNDRAITFGLNENNKFYVNLPCIQTFYPAESVLRTLIELEKEEQIELKKITNLAESQASIASQHTQKSQKSQQSQQQQQQSAEKSQQDQQEQAEEQEQEIPAKEFFTMTMTLHDGSIIKYLPNGEVFFTSIPEKESYNRLITGKATVIQYNSKEKITALFANGNTMEYDKKSQQFVETNNKGFRVITEQQTGEQRQEDQIPAAKCIDPDNQNEILVRDDGVTVIDFTDGTRLTTHKDGTKYMSSADDSMIVTEHPDYPTVTIFTTPTIPQTEIPSSSYSTLGSQNIMERSYDGRVLEISQPDGTKVIGFLEKQSNSSEFSYVYLVYYHDGSVMKFNNQNGEIVFIALKEKLGVEGSGEENAYFQQLFAERENRGQGVYTCELMEGNIGTKDGIGNEFRVNYKGEIDIQINQLKSMNKKINERINQLIENEENNEIMDEELKQLPQPMDGPNSRLFVISNKNIGMELLNEEQLQTYFYLSAEDENSEKKIQEQNKGYPSGDQCFSMTFLNQLQTLKEYYFLSLSNYYQRKKQKVINLEAKTNLDILPKQVEKSVIPPKLLSLRNFLQFQEFSQEEQEQFLNSLDEHDQWISNVSRSTNEFGYNPNYTKEELAQNLEIMKKIKQSRQGNYNQENFDTFCTDFIQKVIKQGDQAQEDFECIQEEERQEQLKLQEEQRIKQEQEIEKKRKVLEDILSFKEKMRQERLENYKVPQIFDKYVQNYFETEAGVNILKILNIADIPPKKIKVQKDFDTTGGKNDYNTSEISVKETEQQQKVSQMGSFYPDQQPQQPQQQELRTTQRMQNEKIITITPSIFQREDEQEIAEQIRKEKEADIYHKSKNYQYNLFGSNQRLQKPLVPCLQRTFPKAEINSKYILTDSITDQRNKISSMANRIYFKAPQVNQIRRQGQFHNLLQTIDKQHTLEDVLEKKNLMITADITDKLKRDLLIIPVSARFGKIKSGGIYETVINVKNEDIQVQRVNVKQPSSKYVRTYTKQSGPVALGLTREIFVRLEATKEMAERGKFEDEFQIISKHEIYTIPIKAEVLDPARYKLLEQDYQQQFRTSVREIKFKEDKPDFLESQSSDKLPKLGNFDRSFKFQQSSKNQEQTLEEESDSM